MGRPHTVDLFAYPAVPVTTHCTKFIIPGIGARVQRSRTYDWTEYIENPTLYCTRTTVVLVPNKESAVNRFYKRFSSAVTPLLLNLTSTTPPHDVSYVYVTWFRLSRPGGLAGKIRWSQPGIKSSGFREKHREGISK